jgi:hypothetical protein
VRACLTGDSFPSGNQAAPLHLAFQALWKILGKVLAEASMGSHSTSSELQCESRPIALQLDRAETNYRRTHPPREQLAAGAGFGRAVGLRALASPSEGRSPLTHSRRERHCTVKVHRGAVAIAASGFAELGADEDSHSMARMIEA